MKRLRFIKYKLIYEMHAMTMMRSSNETERSRELTDAASQSLFVHELAFELRL